MNRHILAAWFLLATCLGAAAQSTINPNVPAQSSQLTSAPIRNNFAAAYNDVTNILGEYPGATAPGTPVIGQFWRKTSVSPQLIYQWTGGAWSQISTFDTATGKITPYFGNSLLAWQQLLTGTGGLGTSGQCVTSTGASTVPTMQTCLTSSAVSATSPVTWNSGTSTVACPTCATTTSGGAITGTSPIVVSAGGAISIANNGISNALLRQGGALSVIGVTGNATANVADISATPASDAVLRESGSTLGFGTIATGGIANNAVTLAKLATQATNTVLANVTSGTAVPTAFSVGSCDTATKALNWTTNTGFVCNSSITAAAVPASGLTGTTLASGVVISSLTTVGALGAGSATTGFTVNAANVTWSGQIPGVSVATAANASGAPSATFGVVKCDGLTVTCASGVISAAGGVASSIAVGTTTITSGASGNLEFNNAGVLSEVTPGNGVAIIGSTLGLTAARRTLPTTQNFTSGTGATYTTPANVLWIEVWACGGGGGGAGAESGTNTIVGTAGTTTTFNSVNAVGGSGGSASTGGNSTPPGGAGGTGGTGTATVRMAGNTGQNGGNSSALVVPSGAGGGSPLFGGSTPGKTTTAAGNAGIAGSGAGGAGAINLAGANNTSGAGGGSGECFYLIINSPSPTYTYTVGPGGAGGVSTSNGGAGANGQVLVKEHYGT